MTCVFANKLNAQPNARMNACINLTDKINTHVEYFHLTWTRVRSVPFIHSFKHHSITDWLHGGLRRQCPMWLCWFKMETGKGPDWLGCGPVHYTEDHIVSCFPLGFLTFWQQTFWVQRTHYETDDKNVRTATSSCTCFHYMPGTRPAAFLINPQ